MHISSYRGRLAMVLLELEHTQRVALARLLGLRVPPAASPRRLSWLIAWRLIPREAGLNPESYTIPLTRDAAVTLVSGLLTLTPAVYYDLP